MHIQQGIVPLRMTYTVNRISHIIEMPRENGPSDICISAQSDLRAAVSADKSLRPLFTEKGTVDISTKTTTLFVFYRNTIQQQTVQC